MEALLGRRDHRGRLRLTFGRVSLWYWEGRRRAYFDEAEPSTLMLSRQFLRIALHIRHISSPIVLPIFQSIIKIVRIEFKG